MEALNTYLHFAVLYGQSPVGLPKRELLKNADRDNWDEKFNRALQETAGYAATHYPTAESRHQRRSESGMPTTLN